MRGALVPGKYFDTIRYECEISAEDNINCITNASSTRVNVVDASYDQLSYPSFLSHIVTDYRGRGML